MLDRLYELDTKINSDNLPSVRVLQTTFAGSNTGKVSVVVAFKSLKAWAETETLHAGNAEWAALSGAVNQKYPVTSAMTDTQLLIRPGK